MSYDYNKKFQLNTGRPVRQLEYSKIIWSLMYAVSNAKSDITFSVGRLSRFTCNPGKPHWDAIQS